MGLLAKAQDVQRQVAKGKSAPPKEAKTPAKAEEKKVAPAKTAATKTPVAKPAPAATAKKEVSKPAPKKVSPKPEVKKSVPVHKKVVEEMHPPDDDEVAEAQKEETRRQKAKAKKSPKKHYPKKQSQENDWEDEEDDDSQESEKTPSKRKAEDVKITPVSAEKHEDKFFLLKIGDFVTGLGRRLSPAQKEELEKAKAAAKQSKKERLEVQQQKPKKKHRIRLIILLIILGAILEIIILTILNRLGIITKGPFEGPIVTTLAWIGRSIGSALGSGSGTAGASNVYVIFSIAAIVLLLGATIVFVRKIKKKHEAEKAKDKVSPMDVSTVATATTTASKQAPAQTSSETTPSDSSAGPETTEAASAKDEAKTTEEGTNMEIQTKDLGPERSMAEPYITSIDELYNYVQTTGKITITEISKRFKISKELAEEWTKILESHELITVEYPIFSSPILTKYKVPPEEKE